MNQELLQVRTHLNGLLLAGASQDHQHISLNFSNVSLLFVTRF